MIPGICFITVTLYVLIEHSSCLFTEADGCSATPILEDKPFVVVWNHPTAQCGIHPDLDKWGIVDNARDRFFGQQIALFYYLGKWPYYQSKEQPANGGLPQLSDLQAHLTKVDADVKALVWNKTFSGLGIIDMEFWRPLFWTNYDSRSIYQRQSLALAKQRFPNYNKTQVLAEAIKEFNKGARDFMSQTLQHVSTLRPNGKWGYYYYPQCFDPTCGSSTVRNNDRISWLFQESSALYPSIYFKMATPRSGTANFIKKTLHEAFRVKAKYSAQNIPVMPYSRSQEGPYKLYQKMDLSLAVLQPAQMGSSGVVIWGSSSDLRAKNECLVLKDYIDNVLGPYSRNVTNFFGNCSQQLCEGHGRCVRKDYERTYQTHLRESGRSDCLLPDDILKDKNVARNTNKKTSGITIDKTNTRYKQKKVIGKKNKVLGFLDHVRNYFNVNLKRGNQYEMLGGREKMSVTQSKSVVNFSIKKPKENEDLNPTLAFNVFAPDYDFDDYVCKCYPGFTGNRCEKNISN